MFKRPFDDLMTSEDSDMQVAPRSIENLERVRGEDGCPSCRNTNICECDPLDMSNLTGIPADEDVPLSAGNTDVCEYDPLNVSTPINVPIDEVDS
jgi:hypothetical protein